MKTLLVPTDFSPLAAEALKFAAAVASVGQGSVTLLHSINIPALYDLAGTGGEMYGYAPSIINELEDVARAECERLKLQFSSGPGINYSLLHEDLVHGIDSFAKEIKADMIVMGTSGANGLQELLIGSTTERVVRHSSIPVLVIRKACTVESIRNILFAFDPSEDLTYVMPKLKELQHFFGAHLQVLLINTPSNFRTHKDGLILLERLVKEHDLRDYSIHFVNYYSEADGIADFAIQNKCDMIAMATHSRRGLSHIFNGSITEDVLSALTCPIWTCTLKAK
jgi:nucleotide-binding universal stress UspA family protein